MIKLLSSVDKWIISIIKIIVGASLVVLTFAVFLQVLTRYVLKVSIGGIGELPAFLMIISVWLAGAILARHDDHVKLEVIKLIFKNKTVLKCIQLFVHILTLASVAVFTYLSFEYVQFGIETGDITDGLHLPLWCLTTILLVSGMLMTVYHMLNLYREVKEFGKWKS